MSRTPHIGYVLTFGGAVALFLWSRTKSGSAVVSEAVRRIAELPIARRREIYRPMFDAASARYRLPPGLLARVGEVESSLNPLARSSAGAVGIMQVVPRWHPSLGEAGALDPEKAIPYAAKILRAWRDEFDSWALALAAYNAGPGAVRQYGMVPPFTETRAYIQKILPAVGIVESGIRFASVARNPQ
jgi:soluble lytic murein transglycosylase-like protein